MIFKATLAQVKQIAANAVNASTPRGMGILHYKADHEFTASDFNDLPNPQTNRFSLDYVEGRMVKLWISRLDNDQWEIPPQPSETPTPDYQSWCWKYPTYTELALSVEGVEIIKGESQ